MTIASYEHHGNRDQPALVLLHGVGSGKEGFAAQRQTVVDAVWQFLAIDAPGFGNTPLPAEPGFGDHVAAVLGVLDHLGIERAVLLGHSLGGMTAQEVFAHHRDRVAGLILSATSPAFGKPDGDFQKEFLQARLEPFENGMTMPEFAAQFSKNLVGSNAENGAVDAIIDVMSSVSIEAYSMAMKTLTRFDQRANLSNIGVPTLLIAGEEDRNSPAPMMEKMASKIAYSQYVMLPKTGHMAPIENHSAFNEVVKSFLEGMKPQ